MAKMNKIYIPDLTPHLEQIRQENEADRKRAEFQKLMQDVQPFPDAEMTEKAKEKRIEKSKQDFWYWDKTYFTPDAYDDYAEPGWFQKELVQYAERRDKKAIIIHGPRDSAKTITYKKRFFYDLLHGNRRFMGFGSEVVTTGEDFLTDLVYLYELNPRLRNDYKIDWIEQSQERLFARSNVNPKGTFVVPLSARRSSRGKQRMFFRFDYIYITDLENEKSPKSKEARDDRIKFVNEARTSLSKNGVLIWEGNNFDPDLAMNQLFDEDEKGLLSEQFEMHRYSAWDETRIYYKMSIWYKRYPATTEAEMRAHLKPLDDYDWAGNYQGKPKRKSGDQFPDTYYHEWESLPNDLKSVLYADPNLSLKGKGDTTAITNLGFSPSTQLFYIVNARCKSYSDSNDLLKDYLILKKEADDMEVRVLDCSFDGNVTQESQWTNNIRNFVKIEGFPYPPITFCHYVVDDIVTPVSADWKKDKFRFPPGFKKTKEGSEYCRQHFGFKTKKEKKKDDAPDSMICAYTRLSEIGIIVILGGNKTGYKSVTKRKIYKI